MNLQLRNPEQCYQEMRALWNEWDPIGVSPSESGILDEYDFYLEPTLLLLKQEATTDEIENYLNFVIEERMGLDKEHIRHCKPHEFAKKLQAWFQTWKMKISTES